MTEMVLVVAEWTVAVHPQAKQAVDMAGVARGVQCQRVVMAREDWVLEAVGALGKATVWGS